ncbi:MAG: GNAT family N-acetyltransferase [Candidatus Dormiibacterota bacterium]
MRLSLRSRLDPGRAVDVHALAPAEAGAVVRTLRHPVIVEDRLERQARGDCVYLIAWERGRPVGQTLLHWRRPPTVWVGSAIDRIPYVEDLFVLPEARRRGIGSALLEAAAEAAASHGDPGLSLAVSVENHTARHLYDQRGYAEAGIAPRRQPTSEQSLDGSTRSFEEVVVDLVRWLDRPVTLPPPGR